MLTHVTAAALLHLAVASASLTDGLLSVAPASFTSVSGVIRDEMGGAVEGAEVLVLAPQGPGSEALLRGISDAAGHFLISGVPPGVYRVAAIKSGYLAMLGRVNTVLRSSVTLVLRPIPEKGQPGAETVMDDLSWTLRVPPRSILRTLKAGTVVARDTGGARAFAAHVEESIRGEVGHMFAFGSRRGPSSGAASNLAGNEIRMRIEGNVNSRGSIQVRGRRANLDSTSSPLAFKREGSGVDLDVSYVTQADDRFAMRAFYSTGELAFDDRSGGAGSSTSQSQRSFGYDAQWSRQLDASSQVAVQVGFEDALFGLGQGLDANWGPAERDAWNRAIGAEGSYEDRVADGHLVRCNVRAQLLTLHAPAMRVSGDTYDSLLHGAAGGGLLVDAEDLWSVASPFALSYGLAARQGFAGSEAVTLTPHVSGSWTAGRVELGFAVSYSGDVRSANRHSSSPPDGRSPYGYEAGWKARLDPRTTVSAAAAYVPTRAQVWPGQRGVRGPEGLYVSDGFASDRFTTIGIEHVTPAASIALNATLGRVDGVVAMELYDAPVLRLSNRTLDYRTVSISLRAPRAGSTLSVGYRSIRDRDAVTPVESRTALKTIDMEFAQNVVRFSGGRASCRLLVTAKTAVPSRPSDPDAEAPEIRRSRTDDTRLGAGVSLTF